MTNDFIVEEESSNRTFIYVAAGMGALLLVGLITIVAIALINRSAGANGEIAIMNQTIEAQNALVTQTIAAMETAAAYTPTPPPVALTAAPTEIPTFTPSPGLARSTPSPVAQTPAPEDEATSVAAVDTPPPQTPTTVPGNSELPAGGLEMWGAVVAGVVLIAVIVLARRLRPAV